MKVMAWTFVRVFAAFSAVIVGTRFADDAEGTTQVNSTDHVEDVEGTQRACSSETVGLDDRIQNADSGSDIFNEEVSGRRTGKGRKKMSEESADSSYSLGYDDDGYGDRSTGTGFDETWSGDTNENSEIAESWSEFSNDKVSGRRAGNGKTKKRKGADSRDSLGDDVGYRSTSTGFDETWSGDTNENSEIAEPWSDFSNEEVSGRRAGNGKTKKRKSADSRDSLGSDDHGYRNTHTDGDTWSSYTSEKQTKSKSKRRAESTRRVDDDDRSWNAAPEIASSRSESFTEEIPGRRTPKGKRKGENAKKKKSADSSESPGYGDAGYHSIVAENSEGGSHYASGRQRSAEFAASVETDDGSQSGIEKKSRRKDRDSTEIVGRNGGTRSRATELDDDGNQSVATETDIQQFTEMLEGDMDGLQFFKILRDKPEMLSAVLSVLVVRGGEIHMSTTIKNAIRLIRDRKFKDTLVSILKLYYPNRDIEQYYGSILCTLAVLGEPLRLTLAKSLFGLYGPAINILVSKFHDDTTLSCSDLQMVPDKEVGKGDDDDENFEFWSVFADFSALKQSLSSPVTFLKQLGAEIKKMYRNLREHASPKTICENGQLEELYPQIRDTARPIVTKWCTCSERQTCRGRRCSYGLRNIGMARQAVATQCEVKKEISAKKVCHDENVLKIVNMFSAEDPADTAKFWKWFCVEQFQIVIPILESSCRLWGDAYPFKDVATSLAEGVGSYTAMKRPRAREIASKVASKLSETKDALMRQVPPKEKIASKVSATKDALMGSMSPEMVSKLSSTKEKVMRRAPSTGKLKEFFPSPEAVCSK